MRLSKGYIAAIIALLGFSACMPAFPAVEGKFERTLSVNGPINLEVATGSGKIDVRAGSAGAVRIYGFIRANDDRHAMAEDKVRYLEATPPISQTGGSIRIGQIENPAYRNNVSISYEIEAPPETRLLAKSGSGRLQIGGLRGPVDASTGSGSISVANIGDEVNASTGSGSIELQSVAGIANLRAGSGSIRAGRIAGSIKASTGSGHISLEQIAEQTAAESGASLDVEAHTGSGGIEIYGASGSLRASTGSGSITANGNPKRDWNINTSSGSVHVEFPSASSFYLQANTSSGRINAERLDGLMGSFTRKSIRGKVRGGGSTVDIRTGSGSITIR